MGLSWLLTFLAAVPFIIAVAAFAAQVDLDSDRALLLWFVGASALACAVLIGLLQERVLRGWLDVGWPWVVATASGVAILWPLAIVVFDLARVLSIPDWPQQWEEVGGWGWSIAWVATGVAQYLVLQQRGVRRAGWWVLVNASGAIIGLRVGSWVSGLNSPGRWWPELRPDIYAPPAAWILGAVLAVCAVAVGTGVALVCLLGRGPTRPNGPASDDA